jgi:hypothetical protein
MPGGTLGQATKKAKVYKAIKGWIQRKKRIEKQYINYCALHDICIYCNDPLDSKQLCEACEPELHNKYYLKEGPPRNFVPCRSNKKDSDDEDDELDRLYPYGYILKGDDNIDPSMLKYYWGNRWIRR